MIKILCTWSQKNNEKKSVISALNNAIIENTVAFTPFGIDAIVHEAGDNIELALNILETTHSIFLLVDIDNVLKIIQRDFEYVNNILKG